MSAPNYHRLIYFPSVAILTVHPKGQETRMPATSDRASAGAVDFVGKFWVTKCIFTPLTDAQLSSRQPRAFDTW